MSITRRRLLASTGAGLAGAGAIGVLSACGSEEEEPSAERDVELLNAALEAQRTVASMYESLPAAAGPGGLTLDAFSETASAQVDELTTAIDDAGGSPSDTEQNPPEAESATEALTLALNDAIVAYHAAAGDLSTPELNGMALEFIAADAAQFAALRGELGEEQAPVAFVTGLDEPPLVAAQTT
jgi:hypothetical protein